MSKGINKIDTRLETHQNKMKMIIRMSEVKRIKARVMKNKRQRMFWIL